jgi:zinc transport system substrate-binding protein
MCPGHFDAKPSEIAALKKASCVLLHDWQKPMPPIVSVLAAAQIAAEKVHTIDVPGNWLVPAVQEQAVERVTAVLVGVDPSRADEYRATAALRIEAVRRAGETALTQLKDGGCGGMNIVCHDKLAGFLKWAGFAVVLEYGQDGQLSAGRMAGLVREGRAARVKLVVDNVQGGGLRTGAAIARDTGAAHVILSNFPGGFSGVDTWEATLRKNVNILVRAAKGATRNGS